MSPPGEAPATRRITRPGTVLAVASIGGFLAFLDATIVNVAVPSIVEAYDGATLDSVSWVLNAYNIVFAAFLVASGRLADLMGRKRVFELGIVVFTFASLLCAVAPTLEFLIFARAMQALGAAVIVPSSLALVMVAYPGPQQARGIALWSAGAALAAGVGPATGGALIEVLDWRWCFVINIPIGVAAWRLSGRQLVESRAPGRRSVPDLLGALVLAGAIGALTLGIVQGEQWGYIAVETLTSWALSVVLLAWFVRRCRRHRSPVVDLALLRVRSFSVANLLTFAAAMGFYGYILCNVLFLTVVWGYSPLEAGLALTPGPFVAAAIAAPLGRLAERVDPRAIILPGGLVWALGLVYMVTRVGPEPAFVAEWLPGMVLLGIGAGATFPTLGSAAAGAAPGGSTATATALNSVARQFGAVIGVAILVSIIGTPTPGEALDAFDAAWTFAAACLAVAAVGALGLGRIRVAEPEAVDLGSVPAEGLSGLALAHLLPVAPGAAQRLLSTEAPPDADEPLSTFLSRVTMFEGLDRDRLDELAAGAGEVYLRGGEVLFRYGDAAEGMYVVLTGRLEVLIDGVAVAEVSSGGVVGELALLASAPRAATIRARRDSVLIELPRAHFERLVDDAPGFARDLVRVLGAQLQQAKGQAVTRSPLPTIIGVVSAGPQSVQAAAALGEALGTELGRIGTAVVLHGRESIDVGRYAGLVAAAERDYDRVVLVAGEDPEDEWTAFCLRHPDRVLAVATVSPPERWAPPAALLGCDLVLAGPDGMDSRTWLEQLQPRTTYRVAPGDPGAVALMARRLTGTSVGIVFSGGGARGLAHVGVLEELLAAGVTIDRVGGTSMGSFIGAMFAAGMGIEEIDARCYEEWVRRRPLADYGVPRSSIIRGQRVREMLWRTFSGPIELAPRPFFCVSVDLLGGELHVHRRGSLGLAVGASMNLPGVAPPLAIDGRLLVDGGLRNNLPVDVMAAADEGPIIAVDVGGAARLELQAVRERLDGEPALRRQAGRLVNDEEDHDVLLPSLPELMTRIVTLSSSDGAALAAKHAQLIVRPHIEHVGLFEFHMLDDLRAAGRREARRVLAAAADATAGTTAIAEQRGVDARAS